MLIAESGTPYSVWRICCTDPFIVSGGGSGLGSEQRGVLEAIVLQLEVHCIHVYKVLIPTHFGPTSGDLTGMWAGFPVHDVL